MISRQLSLIGWEYGKGMMLVRTVAENIRLAGDSLLDRIKALLGENAYLRDINEEPSTVFFVGPSCSFNELPIEKKRLQSSLIEEQIRFIEVVRSLLRLQPASIQKSVDNWEQTIKEIIEQTHLVWYSTTDQAMDDAKRVINEIYDAINCLHDSSEGLAVLIPDTNALIYSPAFQSWNFESFERFEILLVPTLLEELDSLKVKHQNPEVRQKAQNIIRQIKEYRRRGPLNDGVTIIANKISLRTFAVEPHVEDALPWLDKTSCDDRILASCVEAMRMHPRSVVTLVTGDINLQNKAEYSRIMYIEPPELPI